MEEKAVANLVFVWHYLLFCTFDVENSNMKGIITCISALIVII